jgi:hypothetical protein
MGFDLNKEKLRCLVVLDDDVASKLSCAAGPAYCRGFILENRETHEVFALYRFKYEDGERNWFRLIPKEQTSVEAAVEDLRLKIETVLNLAIMVFGVKEKAAKDAILSFYPPDDEGDPAKTIIWLEQQDLVEITVEKNLPEGTDA